MVDLMRWVVWYGDGARRASDEWRVQDLPGCNVQVIAQEHPEVGRIILKGRDYYVWRGEDVGWDAVNEMGLYDYLFVETGWRKALAGRTIGNDRFREAELAAEADPFLPPKSALARHLEPPRR